MRARSTIGLVVLALLGLVLAAGITMAASSLTSQRVGLSAEPLSAGDELVPQERPATTPARSRARTTRTSTTSARTTTTPAPAPTATTDDHGGDDHGGAGDEGEDDSGRGRGRGRGGDD